MAHNPTLEPGYRPVLVREETKRALQRFRFSLNDHGRAEERRLADAMIFVALAHKELYDEVLERVRRLAIEDDAAEAPGARHRRRRRRTAADRLMRCARRD